MFKKIGIYGGSFDPVHFGHLNLAIELKEKHQLDVVCFYPAFINPIKFFNPGKERGFASPQERLEMVQLAVEQVPGLTYSELEYQREGPSFTIETVRFLAQHAHGEQFYLILGEDAALNFHRWHEPEQLIRLAKPLVGARSLPLHAGDKPWIEQLKGSQELISALREGYTHISTLEISASEIRKRLAQGLYCGHLLPAKVLDYIKGNRLYFLSPGKQ